MNAAFNMGSLILAATLFLGCATFTQGSTQQVIIDSEPIGAWVKVDDERVGLTPITIELDRAKSHTVVIEKEGYLARSEVIGSGISSQLAGNALLLSYGIIGICVDLYTGAAYELAPQEVHPALTACGPKEQTSISGGSTPVKAATEPEATK